VDTCAVSFGSRVCRWESYDKKQRDERGDSQPLSHALGFLSAADMLSVGATVPIHAGEVKF
jgi:hypothetical protein